ncbi:HD domain-containing protein [Tardiphaga robiniae]|uniref:Phosphohydrolase n=1 Tax=Tardiphaga robiniae TaxID=943830 RepID=A0A161SSI3_9BRAD|nr:HD domain-containing protein [Tardiphaga robiniae]KZD24302.1 phosphohydrolase [Tardiphaga robiniae]
MTEITGIATAFAPFETLASSLLHHIKTDDGSHDVAHLARVWSNVRTIQDVEGGDSEILAAATLLHDCVAVEKSSPLRASASRLAAEHAVTLLAPFGWTTERLDHVAHAIAAHSFSAKITPETIEAQILQDADRLDAMGAIGIARCFYTAGRMQSLLYDPEDPAARHRAFDDRNFAIDHLPAKLLTLADGFNTATGRRMAQERHARTEAFLTAFLAEVGVS